VDITGKVAIVTGSGSAAGIGRSTAIRLAQAGAAGVVVNYASPASREKAEAVASSIEEAGARPLVHRADVSDDHQCRAMVDAAVGRFGRLDILVNNAATTVRIRYEDLDAVTDEVWDRILRVNLRGTFQCIRAAAPHLGASGQGAVVNVASIAGIRAVGASSIPYAASKAAVINMTMLLARALAPRVRVNCVTPGFVAGQWMEESLGPERYAKATERTSQRVPMGRVATPDDVAHAILSLITSDFVTGHNLICDGGYLIRD
jgi:3-oxoacyl-[acyl-carrier protein] reductase